MLHRLEELVFDAALRADMEAQEASSQTRELGLRAELQAREITLRTEMQTRKKELLDLLAGLTRDRSRTSSSQSSPPIRP